MAKKKPTKSAARAANRPQAKPAPAGLQTGAAPGGFTLHVLVASTGELMTRLAEVAASQFSSVSLSIVSHPFNDDTDKLRATLGTISGPGQIVLHAVAAPDAKLLIRNHCVLAGIPQFDVTGPLVDFLAERVAALPDNDVARLHRPTQDYQRRIEAMEFAMQHDDGCGLATLKTADIVLVGLSRVSKSPTAIYLASRGFKAANVSISPQTGFPKELAKVSKKKIVALTTQPKRLQQIRSVRMAESGVDGQTDYDNLPAVIREVMDAEAEYKRRGYPVLDVTDSTIEHTAARILDLLGLIG